MRREVMGKDTRIEDRRKAGWSDKEILAALRSTQYGSQVWMNRDADPKRDLKEYMDLAERLKALYTPEEIAWLSTAEAAQRFAKDPVSFMALYSRASLVH
jgi:hypothetical protein